MFVKKPLIFWATPCWLALVPPVAGPEVKAVKAAPNQIQPLGQELLPNWCQRFGIDHAVVTARYEAVRGFIPGLSPRGRSSAKKKLLAALYSGIVLVLVFLSVWAMDTGSKRMRWLKIVGLILIVGIIYMVAFQHHRFTPHQKQSSQRHTEAEGLLWGQLQERLSTSQEETAKLKDQLADNQSQLSQLKDQLASNQTDLSQTKQQLQSTQSELDKTKDQLNSNQQQLSQQQEQDKNLQEQLRSKEEQIQSLQQKVTNTQESAPKDSQQGALQKLKGFITNMGGL